MTDPMHPMPARAMPTISTLRAWADIAIAASIFGAAWAVALFIAVGLTLGLISLLIRYPWILEMVT